MAVKAFKLARLFAEVSLTGGRCWLMCRHCMARYLRGMLSPPEGGNAVYRLLASLARKGVKGVLLSGGLSRDGQLPWGVEVVEQLWRARREFNLVFNMHAGFERRRWLLESLVGLVDVVDYEVSLSKWMVNFIRRLNIKPRETIEVMEAMLEAGLDVVPHIYLWHPDSSPQLLREELRAVDDLGARMVTLLVYIPPNPSEPLPPPQQLVELLRLARSTWPRELSLGCMRPYRVKEVLDRAAVEEELVDRIANPHRRVARMYAGELDFYDACCSLPEHLLPLFHYPSTESTMKSTGTPASTAASLEPQ